MHTDRHTCPQSCSLPEEKMLLSNQLKDVESWAGKGNVSEANLDFVQKALAMPENTQRNMMKNRITKMITAAKLRGLGKDGLPVS